MVKDKILKATIMLRVQKLLFFPLVMINVALFGKTAKEWREENSGQKGNTIKEGASSAMEG